MMQSTEYIVELRSIADAIADYHTDAAIANNAGIATQVMGVVTGIVGIVAAPFTSGTSLILTGVGIWMARAGQITNDLSNSANIANQKKKQEKVNEIIEQYLKMTKHLTGILTQLNQSLIEIEKKGKSAADFISTALVLVNRSQDALRTISTVSVFHAELKLAWEVFLKIKDVKELERKITEMSNMIRQIATSMEKERGNFDKALSDNKGCDELKEIDLEGS